VEFIAAPEQLKSRKERQIGQTDRNVPEIQRSCQEKLHSLYNARIFFPKAQGSFHNAQSLFHKAQPQFHNAEHPLPQAQIYIPNAQTPLPNAQTFFPNALTFIPQARTSFPNAEFFLLQTRLNLPSRPTVISKYLESFPSAFETFKDLQSLECGLKSVPCTQTSQAKKRSAK
jgi:hypothetical protein